MATAGVINVTICGGGNGAHTLAGIASMKDNVSVTVLNIYEDEPERWNQALADKGFTVNLPNGGKIEQSAGSVNFKVTRDVKGAVTSADVVIMVCPAYAHEIYFELIVEHLTDSQIVVGMPGQPGFEYQCLYYLKKHEKKCSFMGLETLPWACRIDEYGHIVSVLGFKDEVKASLVHQHEERTASDPFAMTQNVLGSVPVLQNANSALEIILVSKAIIHPPILYTAWQDWTGDENDMKPLFYQGVDQRAASCLDTACNELIAVANKVKQLYPKLGDIKVETMHQWLLDHYGDQITNKSTLLTSLKTNKAYDGLVHPMIQNCSGKFVPDFSYRYMTEDVPYGIVVQRAIAEMVGVETPMIDSIITWAQELLGVDYLVDGKVNTKLTSGTRIPQIYGLNSIEDVINFSSH